MGSLLSLTNNVSSDSEKSAMNDRSEGARLEAKRKPLKFLMLIMVVFMVAGPRLGLKFLAEEFTHPRWEETETTL